LRGRSLGHISLKRVSLMIPEDVEIEVCRFCGQKKYRAGSLSSGFYPLPVEDGFPIAKSEQYFGSGGQAYRFTVVDKATYQSFTEAGIKGAHFVPCA
jgi:hypothetical protein